MKKMFVVAAAAFLVALTGCNSGTPGGPGVDKNKDKRTTTDKARDAVRNSDDTFTLSVPSAKLKQGESKTETVSISRGKNFDQDVTLKFDGLPTGVTIDPTSPAIKHGDKEVKLTVKAADDAALGDFTAKVTGHPTKGADSTNEMKITVSKK